MLQNQKDNMELEELFGTVEKLTGLEISIYPAKHMLAPESITNLSGEYRRHMSHFCRLVKGGAPRGCKGYDSMVTNNRAGEIKQPFVQCCHAGIAEVIIPLFDAKEHIATVFIGQVITEKVKCEGLKGIKKRLKDRKVDHKELECAYNELIYMSEADLLRIGKMVFCALQGIVGTMSVKMLEKQMKIQKFPQILKAIQIFDKERNWNISQEEMAERVNTSVAYFSRLFKKVIGQNFTDYTTARRMLESQNLLHQTNLSISQIAMEVGYSRHSYFTNRFKSVTGMSPSQYRQNRLARHN